MRPPRPPTVALQQSYKTAAEYPHTQQAQKRKEKVKTCVEIKFFPRLLAITWIAFLILLALAVARLKPHRFSPFLSVFAPVACGDTLLQFYKTAVRLQLEGAVVSWFVRSPPERAFRVRALAGDRTFSCVLGQDALISVSPPRCINGYRWA